MGWDKFKKLLAPLDIVGVLLLKFGAKLKFLILPLIKFFPMALMYFGLIALLVIGMQTSHIPRETLQSP